MDANANANDDAPPMLTADDAGIKEMMGLFDAPAFARRGADLEHALARLRRRLAAERSGMLDMVRLRLRQWSGVATGPDDHAGAFSTPVAPLYPLAGAPTPSWSPSPAPARRRLSVARDLSASVDRFNRRWLGVLHDLKLDPINRRIDDFNRYYVIEKECVLGSSRLALRHFVPEPRLSIESLLIAHPLLPAPPLLP